MNTITLDIAPSPWTGSNVTAEIVKKSLAERYGEDLAKSWNPDLTRTFRNWLMNGYKVKRGEKAIRSFTLLEGKDKDGQKHRFRKPVFLFHFNQCEKI
jgi:hypothetical protein